MGSILQRSFVMSDGNWYSKPEFIVLVSTVLVGAFVIFLKSGYGPSQRPNQWYEASQYADRANQRIAVECLQEEVAARLKCANEIEATYREQHTSERDLSAQQYMAIWAFLMAVASIGALAITWIGIVYIRRTLDQTIAATEAAQSAVQVTREIGEAQVRAYITIKSCEIIFNKDENVASFNFEVENTGQSPAMKVRVPFRAFLKVPGQNDATYDGYIRAPHIGSGQTHWIGLKLREEDFPALSTTLGWEKIDWLHINVVVSYRDVFKQSHSRGRVFALKDFEIGGESSSLSMRPVDNIANKPD